MALLTQKAILNTFEEMLEEMPFHKITVSALVKRCDVSSNTFYYHYQDIYDLLDVWLMNNINRVEEDTSAPEDWRSETKALFMACRKKRKAVEHIFNSISRERLEQYLFTQTDDVFNKFVRIRTEGKPLTEEQVSEIATFLRYAFLGDFLKTNWEHFSEDIDSHVERMGLMVNTFVDSVSDAMTKTQENPDS